MIWDAQGYGTDEHPYVLDNGTHTPLVEVRPHNDPEGGAISIDVIDRTMLGIEGYVVFGKLVAQDGSVVMDMRIPNEGLGVSVPSGTYAFSAYYRNCDANCGYLDPPEPLCSMDVSTVYEAGAAINVSVAHRRSAIHN